MKFSFTCDSDTHTKLPEIICGTSGKIQSEFKKYDFGSGIDKIVLTLISHPFNSELKNRRRFTKADKTLWSDVFIPYARMIDSPQEEKLRIVLSCIVVELAVLARKYPHLDFKFDDFSNRLSASFSVFIENPSIIDWDLIEWPDVEKIMNQTHPVSTKKWWKFW